MHFVLELERLPYPLRDTSKNKSNFLFTIEPHLIGGSKIGIEIGWESEKRSENSKCCCYEHLLLLVIATINCRFETKWGSQRSSRMSPPARPFICLINKDSLHAIQQQFFPHLRHHNDARLFRKYQIRWCCEVGGCNWTCLLCQSTFGVFHSHLEVIVTSSFEPTL